MAQSKVSNRVARSKASNRAARSKVSNGKARTAKVEEPVPTVAAVRKMEVMDELNICVQGVGEEYTETIFPGAR